ncbi:MAG: hypothetical protein F4X48_02970 [Acidimicrobiia bacterium]|nr:hypothetical protein [Acidimicrobiia bacterium]MYC57540.1 hypothetical protein [Acidimicrobiia bacterium]MYI30096.1 hypothetical protein [Acidimicrobiia bacterium]
MSFIVIGSAKASPGATSLAVGLSLTWQATTNRQAMLIEADADGGVMAARFGLASNPSLLELSGTARHELSLQGLQTNCQMLADQVPCLVAPGCGNTVSLVLSSMATRLATSFSQFGELDGIADIGRIRLNTQSAKLIECCDLLIVVARPEFEQLVPLVHLARTLQTQNIPSVLVCIGDRPYPPAEMAKTSGLNLLGVMAHDSRVNQALLSGLPEQSRSHRLLLWRTLSELAQRIQQRLSRASSSRVAA